MRGFIMVRTITTIIAVTIFLMISACGIDNTAENKTINDDTKATSDELEIDEQVSVEETADQSAAPTANESIFVLDYATEENINKYSEVNEYVEFPEDGYQRTAGGYLS